MSDAVCINNGFAYPTPMTLVEASCQMMNMPDVTGDLLFRLFPERTDPNTTKLAYRHRNIFCGTTAWRGLGNPAALFSAQQKEKICIVESGDWADSTTLEEQEIRDAATYTPQGCPAYKDLTDLIAFKNEWMVYRHINLMRKLTAEALVYGLWEAVDPYTGAIKHKEKYAINQTVSRVGWSDYNNSSPFLDFFDWKIRYEMSTPYKFDCCAKAIMNSRTFAKMVRNVNAANWTFLFGRYCTDCNQNTFARINEALCAAGLPKIEIYDGYYQECTSGPQFMSLPNGNFNKRYLIPEDTVVIVGCDGCTDTVGERVYTRNASVCDGIVAGPISKVNDHCEKFPRRVELIRAFSLALGIPAPAKIISALVK